MKIDFVVTWLDANDSEWRKLYHRYRGGEHKEDNGRFRNWDFFKYWFRAVENYAPWVNKVFLVTNGKNPDWINPNHPKLVLVKHSDYMPAKYLPTFNSRAIELNFHRIEGLSEHFVYFNDDMYINRPVTPEYYFKKGLPCDSNVETLFRKPSWDPQNKFSTKISIYCNVAILNYHFNRREVVKQARRKWIGPHLGIKGFLTSLILMPSRKFEAFEWRHFEQPMLKSTIQTIWEQEGDMASKTCSQFRQEISFNPYIIRYWQFATNKFYPVKLTTGTHFTLGKNAPGEIVKALLSNKYRSICINDTPYCSDEEFQTIKVMIKNAFESKFPHKSMYEK